MSEQKDKDQNSYTKIFEQFSKQIHSNHIPQINALTSSSQISVDQAVQILREKLRQDDLDFTLPDISVARMKKIISLLIYTSSKSNWESELKEYLLDGNEEQLLALAELLSWQALEENMCLMSYCLELKSIPELKEMVE